MTVPAVLKVVNEDVKFLGKKADGFVILEWVPFANKKIERVNKDSILMTQAP